MKIAAEVFGVEQAMDFDTMETSQYCVLGVLGETVRVPISEAQMEALTKAAAQFKGLSTEPEAGAGDAFDETKEEMTGPPLEHRKMEERPFSIVAGLEGDTLSSSQHTETQGDAPEGDPGLGGMEGLFEENEEEKERKLRAKSQERRQPVQTRTVPRDSAGNPQVPQNPTADLPKISSGSMSDDDFPQG